nr:uncharacterized protein LOC102925517 isoform X3 [Peromyscus maniculatus bairdii]
MKRSDGSCGLLGAQERWKDRWNGAQAAKALPRICKGTTAKWRGRILPRRGDRRASLPAPRPLLSPECGHPRDVSAPPTLRPALHAPIRGERRGARAGTRGGDSARGSRPPSPGVGTRTGTRRAPLPRRQACAPEDPCLQPPRLSQALSEHAACSHEEPRPGTAGLAAVPLAGPWPVVPGLHPGQFQPLRPEAVPADRHRLCQRADHRPQQQQEGSFCEQDVRFLLRLR